MLNVVAPRLVDALAATLTASINAVADKWIRAELSPDWPLVEALTRVHVTHPKLRIGILSPFSISDVKIGCPASAIASEITRWRNQPIKIRRENPTIILGDARKKEEAGLRAVPRVIRHEGVLKRWRSELFSWLEDNIASNTPVQLFTELFRLAREGLVDPVRLDDYTASALKDSERALDALRGELWRINLFPDERVLDTGVTKSRLELNFEARQLLLAASDSPTDVSRLRRLHDVAIGSVEAPEGNVTSNKSVAQLTLQYRELHDPTLLREIELDRLYSVLTPRRKSVPTGTGKRAKLKRKIDLFELLDEGGNTDSANVLEALERLSEAWDLTKPDQDELVVGFNLTADTPMDVRVKVSASEDSSNVWTGDGSATTQMLAVITAQGAVPTSKHRDWSAPLPEGDVVYGNNLLDAAAVQDEVLGGSKYQTLANDYITARAQLTEYERWMRESTFLLLLLKQQAREAVRAFLAAWHTLVDAVNHEEGGGADAIRSGLPLLEAVWGKGADENTYEWCVLGPFHPYILDPLLRLAEYTLSSIGQHQLGKKVTWALGRSLPSYRVLWAANSVLFLARQGQVLEFQATPVSSHPPADYGNGLTQIIRSFLGFHPFAREALVVTLIDPPKGSAIAKNLMQIQKEVGELRVYLVTTHADTAPLQGVEDVVRNLGRFNSVEEWRERHPVKSHVLFNFTERVPDSSSPAGTLGSTPGAHVALKIALETRGVFTNPPRLSPYLTFTPRNSNSPVVDIQRLSTNSLGTPRLFRTDPILSEEVTAQFDRISDLADWAVIGVPSPLGLIAPRRLGAGRLAYLGRETLGPYGLYVYATSLFSVGKIVTRGLVPSPVTPDLTQVETQLTDLAVQSANSVLQIGLNQNNALWEQLGVIVSSDIARGLD
jgi:hypothetical protein